MQVEEGPQFRLHAINYVGVKLFRTPELLSRTFFGMDVNDVAVKMQPADNLSWP